MSLASWQIRGIQRVAQELNKHSNGAATSEVLIKFRRTPSGDIYMQVLETGKDEVLRTKKSKRGGGNTAVKLVVPPDATAEPEQYIGGTESDTVDNGGALDL